MTLFLLWCKQQTTSRKSIARESEWANEWMNGEKNNAVRINFTLNWHFQPIRMQILDPYRCLYTLFASKLESHEIIKKDDAFSLSLSTLDCVSWHFERSLTRSLIHSITPSFRSPTRSWWERTKNVHICYLRDSAMSVCQRQLTL